MRLLGAGVVLVGMLSWTGAVQAQRVPGPPPVTTSDGTGGQLVALNAAAVQRFEPILRLEASLTRNGTCEEDCGHKLRDALQARALPMADYVKLRSSLQIARGDVGGPQRLEKLEPGVITLRKNNVNVYRQLSAELKIALDKSSVGPTCSLCAPVQATGATTSTRR